jgi:predicted RNase H-like HicB family nuclease
MNIPVVIFRNDDGSFTVTSNVINFVTEGDTLDQALSNAREAADCHIEGLRKYKDAEEEEYLAGIDTSFSTMITV